LASTLDFQDLLQRIMTLSMDAIGSITASVVLADVNTGDLTLVCSHGLPEEVKPGARLSSGGGVAEWVFKHGEPVLLQGTPSADPRFADLGRREHVRSALSVPLVGKHGPIGVLSLNNSRRRRAFTVADLDLLTSIGTQAGIAVENARLHEQVEEANRQLTVTVEHLRNLKSTLTSMTAPSLDDSLETMVDAAVEGTGALAGSLTVLDEGDATYQIEVCYIEDGGILLSADDSEYAAAAERITQASHDLRNVSEHPSHSLIRVLTAEGEIIGLLKVLAHPDGPGFNADDREFVDALVEHASIVVFNSMLYEQAESGREALQKAYAELQDKQAQLIQSEKLAAIGQLAAKVCHEINNPLTAISGCTQLMQRRLRADDQSPGNGEALLNYLHTIAAETERCSRITGDLLQFARQNEPRFLEANLHDVLQHALMLIEYKEPAGLEVTTDFDPALPRVIADPQQLTQVFLNLLTNAVQAMPDGGALTVATRLLSGETPYVRVSITDSGEGITEEAAARIFEPFYTTKANGTGLGLTITRGIIEKHHGLVSLAPAVNGGTEATVILPVDATQAPRKPVLSQAPPAD
jgi:signal transduction histidine kinase